MVSERTRGMEGGKPSLPVDDCRFEFHPSGNVQAACTVLLQSEPNDGWMATASGAGAGEVAETQARQRRTRQQSEESNLPYLKTSDCSV